MSQDCSDAEHHGYCLVATGSRRRGGRRALPLNGEEVMGRGDASGLLRDSSVSRRHARVRVVDNVVTVADLGSSNGTFINEVPLGTETVLRPGDTLRLGRLRFLLANPIAGDQTEPDTDADPAPATLSTPMASAPSAAEMCSQVTRSLTEALTPILEELRASAMPAPPTAEPPSAQLPDLDALVDSLTSRLTEHLALERGGDRDQHAELTVVVQRMAETLASAPASADASLAAHTERIDGLLEARLRPVLEAAEQARAAQHTTTVTAPEPPRGLLPTDRESVVRQIGDAVVTRIQDGLDDTLTRITDAVLGAFQPRIVELDALLVRLTDDRSMAALERALQNTQHETFSRLEAALRDATTGIQAHVDSVMAARLSALEGRLRDTSDALIEATTQLADQRHQEALAETRRAITRTASEALASNAALAGDLRQEIQKSASGLADALGRLGIDDLTGQIATIGAGLDRLQRADLPRRIDAIRALVNRLSMPDDSAESVLDSHAADPDIPDTAPAESHAGADVLVRTTRHAVGTLAVDNAELTVTITPVNARAFGLILGASDRPASRCVRIRYDGEHLDVGGTRQPCSLGESNDSLQIRVCLRHNVLGVFCNGGPSLTRIVQFAEATVPVAVFAEDGAVRLTCVSAA